MTANLFLTAAEAAELLRVDVRTLYTYVSRRKVRVQKNPGERQSRYWRADIEAIAGIASDTAPHSSLVPTTQITLITEQGPFYRGQSAIDLSEAASLEQVAELLWDVSGAFSNALPKLPDSFKEVAASVAHLDSGERASTLLPMVEHVNPRSFDFSPEGYARTGADVVRLYAAVAVGATHVSNAPLHEFIGEQLKVAPEYYDLIRRMLVLGADHELDATTYATRALANAGVTPYAIALTGLAAFRGRRLRVGRSELTAQLLEEILDDADPSAPIMRRFRNGVALPGFGSQVYVGTDPRAAAMFKAFDELIADDEEYRCVKAAISFVEELTGDKPDFILASSFMRHKLGGRRDGTPIVAIARVTGWVAHAMEQLNSPFIRPRAAYVGRLPGAVTG